MTDAWNCDSILEVGCGPGLHSEFIAKNYLKSDSTLVSCDFSPQMVLAMKQRYDRSEDNNQLKVQIDVETDYVNDQTKMLNICRSQ